MFGQEWHSETYIDCSIQTYCHLYAKFHTESQNRGQGGGIIFSHFSNKQVHSVS